jgi:crossover junction endodeoxyribonuclease RuvC
MVVVSIDPGLTGACAVIDHNGLRALFDLPTMPIPGVGLDAMVKSKIDGKAFAGLLREHIHVGESAQAVIEAVGTMGGKNNAIQTQGSLLRSLGAIEAVIECCRIPLSYAHPQTWKRTFGLIDSKLSDTKRKAKAMQCARRLYPTCGQISRAKDHNRAEALLIGHWYSRKEA